MKHVFRRAPDSKRTLSNYNRAKFPKGRGVVRERALCVQDVGCSLGRWVIADKSGVGTGLCSTHESWVKFDSTLTQMSRVRVESAVKIQDMSRVRVESRWLSFESEMSQLDTAWVKVESLIFRRENVKILQLSVTLQRKSQPTATFDRTPPPRSTTFSQIR